MSDSFDDMPEIELDDIVGPPKAAQDDEDAIELDLELEPIARSAESAGTSAPPPDDEDAIDLGLELEPAAASEGAAAPTPSASESAIPPLGDIDVDTLASQVAQSQPAVNDELPVIPDGAQEPQAVTASPAATGEGSVDLDALLADIDSSLSAADAAPTRIRSNVEALPDIDRDALSALNVDLDENPAPRATVELGADDVSFDDVDLDDDDDDGGEEELEVMPPLEDEYGEHDQTVEMDARAAASLATKPVEPDARTESQPSPAADDLTPEPLLDVLADEPTLAEPQAPAKDLEPAHSGVVFDEASLELDNDELSFEAEYAPIVGEGYEDDSDGPMTVAPPDDPEAPPLPLSAGEPPGRPKVPLEQLRPDPKTIETLKRLAGPGGEPDAARTALIAAFRGERYDNKALPDGRDVAIGLGRFLVQQGFDAEALAESIVAVMLE